MSDTTQFQLTIYDCPQEQVGPVLALLNDWGLTEAWGVDRAEHTELVLGQEYTAFEERLGFSDEAGDALAQLGVTFECWEDPAYEYMGMYYAHVPGVGTSNGECDANGNVRISSWDLFDMIEAADDLEALKIKAREVTGAPVAEALKPLRERKDAPVLHPTKED